MKLKEKIKVFVDEMLAQIMSSSVAELAEFAKERDGRRAVVIEEGSAAVSKLMDKWKAEDTKSAATKKALKTLREYDVNKTAIGESAAMKVALATLDPKMSKPPTSTYEKGKLIAQNVKIPPGRSVTKKSVAGKTARKHDRRDPALVTKIKQTVIRVLAENPGKRVSSKFLLSTGAIMALVKDAAALSYPLAMLHQEGRITKEGKLTGMTYALPKRNRVAIRLA